jgi:hypothetical protein
MELKIIKEISSETTYNKKYTVRMFVDEFGYEIWRCNCPSFLFGQLTECKHIKRVKSMKDVKKLLQPDS